MKKTKKSKKYKIGIVGLGMVGMPIKDYLIKDKKYKLGVDLFCFDKDKKKKATDDVNKADIIFICVSTPYDPKKGFVLDHIKDSVKAIKGKKIIVIKSTVVPGTTDAFQKKYSQHNFLFNPEFLRETTAHDDFINPDRQILGVTSKSKNIAQDVMDVLPKAPREIIMLAKEAEVVKYMANSFLSLKVVFANEFFDLCDSMNIDYNNVKEGVSADSRIGPSHFDVHHWKYRGYGGSCFPKDVNALIQFASANNVDLVLLKKMRQINRKLLKSCDIHEHHFLHFRHRGGN